MNEKDQKIATTFNAVASLTQLYGSLLNEALQTSAQLREENAQLRAEVASLKANGKRAKEDTHGHELRIDERGPG